MERIETHRLAGRPARADDADFAARLLGRPEVARFAGDAGGAAALAAHWAAHGFGVRVWESEDCPVGLAGLRFCVLEGRAAVEASFAFAPEVWGRGLAEEAMQAVMAEAPSICLRVEAAAHRGNAPAARLLKRLGFAETSRRAAELQRWYWEPRG